MSSWSRIVLATIAGLLVVSLTLQARSPDDHRLVAALLARPSAGTLATAAASARGPSYPPDNAAAQALAARAVALAPDRPELQWLQLRICGLGTCDRAPIEERLKSLDPDNGLLWLTDLERRHRAGEEAEVTAILVEMGARSQFTFYIHQLVVMAFDAVGAADPTMPIGRRAATAWGIITAWALPPLQPLSKSCALDALAIPGRRDACQTLLGKLETSDAVITESIALGIQQRWWPADSPEAAALREKRRRLHYLMQRAGRQRVFRLNHDSAVHMAATRRYRREDEAAIAVLKSFGDPADPPPTWKDPWG